VLTGAPRTVWKPRIGKNAQPGGEGAGRGLSPLASGRAIKGIARFGR